MDWETFPVVHIEQRRALLSNWNLFSWPRLMWRKAVKQCFYSLFVPICSIYNAKIPWLEHKQRIIDEKSNHKRKQIIGSGGPGPSSPPVHATKASLTWMWVQLGQFSLLGNFHRGKIPVIFNPNKFALNFVVDSQGNLHQTEVGVHWLQQKLAVFATEMNIRNTLFLSLSLSLCLSLSIYLSFFLSVFLCLFFANTMRFLPVQRASVAAGEHREFREVLWALRSPARQPLPAPGPVRDGQDPPRALLHPRTRHSREYFPWLYQTMRLPWKSSGSRGPWGPGLPLPPRFFQNHAVLRQFWAKFGLNPPGVKSPLPPSWPKSWIRPCRCCTKQRENAETWFSNFPKKCRNGRKCRNWLACGIVWRSQKFLTIPFWKDWELVWGPRA